MNDRDRLRLVNMALRTLREMDSPEETAEAIARYERQRAEIEARLAQSPAQVVGLNAIRVKAERK